MIENSETKLGNSETKSGTFRDNLNSSKIVALIGTIFLFLYSITMIISGIISMYQPRYTILVYFYQVVFGVIQFFFVYVFFVLIFEFNIIKNEHVDYHWIPLLIGGVLVTFFTFLMPIEYYYGDTLINNPLGVILYYIRPLPGILLIIAAVLEILTKRKKDINIPKVLSLIGVAITFIEVINVIYRSIVNSFFDRISTNEVIMAILALIFAFILLLIISKIDIKIPFNWWVVLIIGIVIIWTSVLGGVIIIAVVILILLKGSLKENEERMLFNEEKELRVKMKKLISTREGKLEWIKTQYYDLKRTLNEIADDLGESFIAVRKYLYEMDSQDISKNNSDGHQEGS